MLPNQVEIPVLIPCSGDTLVGMVHQPEEIGNVGVVVIVAGGPQYRVGAHRQFVTLARMLARAGAAVIRFDHRGTGDSSGDLRGFIDMNEDIHNATNVLCEQFPEIDSIVLWGECESATAGAFYGYTDSRVKGIFMVNPWIRTEQGQAKTILKHYYWERLSDINFWRKVFSGQFSILNSFKSYLQLVKSAKTHSEVNQDTEVDLTTLALPERLAKSCACFDGKLFVLNSGFDLIAQEYKDYVASSNIWQKLIASGNVTLYDIPDSDHTFSRVEWRNDLFKQTEDWIASFLK